MIVTIRRLEELTPERRQTEYRNLAEKAVRLYRTSGSIPTVKDALLLIMDNIRVSGNESDITEILERAASVR